MGDIADRSDRIVNLRVPTSAASQTLANDINSSLASLRGWMLTGNESFKAERTAVWRDIDAVTAELENLSKSWTNPNNIKVWAEMVVALEEFRVAQKHVEDIAHTADEQPAKKILLEEASPLAAILIQQITNMIEEEMKLEASAARKDLFGIMADVRGSTAVGLANIRAYLLSGDEKFKENFDGIWAKNEKRFGDLKLKSFLLSSTQKRAFNAFSSARQAFAPLPQKMFEIRSSKQWNMANNLFTTEVAPQAGKILDGLVGSKQADTARVGGMVSNQKTLLADDAGVVASNVNSLLTIMWVLLAVGVGSSGVIVYLTSRSIVNPIKDMTSAMSKMARGDHATEIPGLSRMDEIGQMAKALQVFKENAVQREQLEAALKENERERWIKTGQTTLADQMREDQDVASLSKNIITHLAQYMDAPIGTMYTKNGGDGYNLSGTYAFTRRKDLAQEIRLGDGLVGQAALEQETILISEVPGDYIQVDSGLGKSAPRNIVVSPVVRDGVVNGVIELGSFHQFTDLQLEFLKLVNDNIAIAIHSAHERAKMKELLEESQRQAEELESQQTEIEATNKELKAQTQKLVENESNLQKLNEELEEQADQLIQEKATVEEKNRIVEATSLELNDKAEQLTLTSKYKSEFLANMSHELRTPLNSLMILSKILSENEDNNLTEKQVEFATTIHSSGNDLLSLINEILDLSKIESGSIEVDVSEFSIAALRDHAEKTFRQVANDKGLGFKIELDQQLPSAIYTDDTRLRQILNNLLSNAFKFTEKGEVTLRIAPATSGWSFDHDALNHAEAVIAIAVHDTGIGIPEDRLKIIFEAFQQVDGTTSRKYGGTGLGLSISREIARLLGGEIRVESIVGKGSTFMLYLPRVAPAQPENLDDDIGSAPRTLLSMPQASEAPVLAPVDVTPDPELLAMVAIPDDRDDIGPDDRVMLIVEDDVNFARILMDLGRDKDFKVVVATRGDVGLALARKFKPDAITLDIRLPEMDGWTVLDQLKHNPDTRHIPVHIISVEHERQRALKLGAIATLEKPVEKEALDEAFANIKQFVDRDIKNLLVVEDDEIQRKSIVELIGNHDVEVTTVATAQEALTALKAKPYDCMVLDLMLPDLSGLELLQKVQDELGIQDLPVIVYTGKELSKKEESALRKVTDTIIVKDVCSPERLLDETSLFLHRIEAELPESKRKILQQVHQKDPQLAGQKVLIVDDDIRNIFAITSVLERQEMEVHNAESGKDAIDLLKKTRDISIVLMDIMMPEMDGYETMEAIRKIEKFKNLPIIALTAKAMKGDREKCIEAGASDYITKPVDIEQLLSLFRVWLYR